MVVGLACNVTVGSAAGGGGAGGVGAGALGFFAQPEITSAKANAAKIAARFKLFDANFIKFLLGR